MRCGEINRKTRETDITLKLNIDGTGKSNVNTGCGFLDHMITLFAKHARFDIDVQCTGDTYVDYHHTTEDIGICLGEAFFNAIGDKRGIQRYGSMILPMDDALILAATDISGRACLVYNVEMLTEKIGNFDCELIKEFWLAFVRKAQITLHVKKLAGENSHHIAEATFKAVARALKKAVETDSAYKDEIPSTKGVL